jgi:ketosteroid isomerase-like protein
MAQADLELVERAVAAFNAGDSEGFAALTTSDFEWIPSMSPIEAHRFVGADGVRRYFAALQDAWERFDVVPGSFREQQDAVLLLGRLEGRGRGSGAAVDSPLGMAFDLREGRISRIRGFLDHSQALRAAGLEG